MICGMADVFTRSPLNPLVAPQGQWCKTYNPGAIIDAYSRVHLFPRAIDKSGNSSILHAIGRLGSTFCLSEQPVLSGASKEQVGFEDARMTQIGDRYYMCFAVNDGLDVDLHLAVSDAPSGPWHRCGLMLPNFRFSESGGMRVRRENGEWVKKTSPKGQDRRSKSGGLFSELIGNEFCALFGEFQMWFATSKDGIAFSARPEPFLTAREGGAYFDNMFVEAGPPPILTDSGWLAFYHGVNDKYQYQLGALLLDKSDPTKILCRSDAPIFTPTAPYEITKGPIDVVPGALQSFLSEGGKGLAEFYRTMHNDPIVPSVVFVIGAVLSDGVVHLFYGASDYVVCTASAQLKAILRTFN